MGHPKPFTGAVGGKTHGGAYEGAYISVGVWGPYPSSETEYVRVNRELESKSTELGGLKWLYSRVFYTEDEWWDIYDKEKYDALREKFHATSLPSIWDKVKDRKRKEEFGTGVKGFLKRVIMKSEREFTGTLLGFDDFVSEYQGLSRLNGCLTRLFRYGT